MFFNSVLEMCEKRSSLVSQSLFGDLSFILLTNFIEIEECEGKGIVKQGPVILD